jgi:serine/threonine-protein kinase
MGVVSKVRDTVLNRVVALKAVRGGDQLRPEEVARFRREAEAVARLDHPHIIRLHEFGEDEGRPYFTMPLAEGGSLSGRLAEFSAPRQAAALVEKVARAVACAHAAGVLHRDLKPSNVLLDGAGEPLVADFGLAKFVGRPTDLTQTGAVLGTPAYMAPEQAAGRTDEVGPAADVWALGAMLYELLAGRLPFQGRNREEMLHRILTTTPPLPRSLRPDLAPALEVIVLKCLRADPSERYVTAGALADDLARWLQKDSLTPSAKARSRRRWLRRVVAAGGLAAVGGVAAVLLSRRPPEEPPPGKPGEPKDSVLIGPDGFAGEVRWAAPRGDATTGRHPKDGAFTLRTTGCTLVELLQAPPWPAFRLEASIRHDEPGRGSVGLTFTHRCYDRRLPEQWCFCRLAFNDGQAGAVGFRGCRWEGALGCSCWSIGGATRQIPPPWSPGRYRDLALEVTPEEVRVFWEDWYRYTISADRMHHQPRRGPREFGHAGWVSIRGGGLGICIDQGAASFRRVVLKPLA